MGNRPMIMWAKKGGGGLSESAVGQLINAARPVQRSFNTRRVMVSPPTISNNASTTASSQAISSSDAAWLYLSETIIDAGSGTILTRNPWDTADGSLSTVTVMEIMTDSSYVEVEYWGNGKDHRLIVNGEFVSATNRGVTTGSISGSHRYHKYDFGTTAPRHLRLEADPATQIYGISIAATASVWKPSTPTSPKVAILGDSYALNSQPSSSTMRGFSYELPPMLGWGAILQAAIGGTGYLATNGTYAKYRDRWAGIAALDPDIVLVTGGLNDYSQTKGASAVGTEAAALFAQIKSDLPDAPLIVVSPQWHYTADAAIPALLQSIADAVETAADGVADLYIDALGEGWFGTRNDALYISANHPTNDGQTYLTYRLAETIAPHVSGWGYEIRPFIAGNSDAVSGGGGGGIAPRFDEAVKATGTSFSSTTWTSLDPSIEVSFDASAGEVVSCGYTCQTDNGSVNVYTDIGIFKGGSLVRQIGAGTATGQGLAGWVVNAGVYLWLNPAIAFQLQAGDIHTDGTVTLRVMARGATATSRFFYGDADRAFRFWARVG